MPDPKAVVAIGSCPASCNVFAGSPVIDGPVDKFIPVDVYVPGCPPRPHAIIQGIAQAIRCLGMKRGAAIAEKPSGKIETELEVA
jgi:membrane-bound hydrogenase subunit mbhJ